MAVSLSPALRTLVVLLTKCDPSHIGRDELEAFYAVYLSQCEDTAALSSSGLNDEQLLSAIAEAENVLGAEAVRKIREEARSLNQQIDTGSFPFGYEDTEKG